MKRLMKFIGMLSWLITACVAIHFAVAKLGYFDLMEMPWVKNLHPMVIQIKLWVILAAGVISLISFLMSLVNSGCHCNCKEHMNK